ncbi:MAG: transposase [Chitinophagaceae bacterium]|nr:transposase [Chitinophagaceae bacterium]
MDQSLQTNYELASSVTGIGLLSVHLLKQQKIFTRFSDVRKLICYCSVAPFEHSSGISIRGKTKS